MSKDIERWLEQRCYSQNEDITERYLDPSDINIPPGYRIEVFMERLSNPISMVFTELNDILIAESGFIDKMPRILRLRNNQLEVFAENFIPPITGICVKDGDVYVSHKGRITAIKPDGSRVDIISGLPSFGDYSNSGIVFGPDNKIYFGQGTATNSGVVGLDNEWLHEYPFLYDYPGDFFLVNGNNFVTNNIFSSAGEPVSTGAFSPYGISNLSHEIKKGVTKASGSILRANFDGSNIELVAWGLRNPIYLKFDHANRLFVSNRSYDVRGSRPISNAPDEFHLILPNEWYGWPDYAGGEPVTLSRFQPEGYPKPEFIMVNHPNVPPRPFASFPAHSSIRGFDFNYNANFGPVGRAYIAEFGSHGARTMGRTPYSGIGNRISNIDMSTGGITTFAINKSGFSASLTREGGLARPVDVVFGPDAVMYVVDYGLNTIADPMEYIPNSGVIWKITRVA